MEIRIERVPKTTIEEFAEKHGLVMEVTERALPNSNDSRYFASFENSDIKEGSMLIGAFGNGATPEEAIANYAKRISLQKLVVDAFGENRKEFSVPRLKIKD